MSRVAFFAIDAALVYYVIQWLKNWDEGRPVYLILAAACTSLFFATKETAFITLGTMAIACVSIWIWEKIGPSSTTRQTLMRYVLIGNALVVATGLYYYEFIKDSIMSFHNELLVTNRTGPEPFLFYSIAVLAGIVIVTWALYLLELNKTSDTYFEDPKELTWKNFREGLSSGNNMLLMIGLSVVIFAYLGVLLFSSFFYYKEGISKAFEAYAIWTKTGTKEHSQNGLFAYIKWGMKGESTILLGSLLGSLVALLKAKHRFAMFTALWAIGVFAAYMIIPYKTPWLALSYILPMCMIAGYGVGEFIQSKDFRLNMAGFVLLIVGTVVLSYQTYELNFVRWDDDQMPYVYAHTRRGFEDMMAKIDHYAEKSGKGKDAVIDVVSPDYWPMTWYTVNYNHVGYHGHLVDTQAELIVTKKKDQDQAAIQKYSEHYKFAGWYPLRPGVDLVLLVRNDIADPDAKPMSDILTAPNTP